LEQVPASDGSAYHEYALTEKGRGLFIVIVALGQWGCGESEFKPVDRKKGRAVKLELRSEDGRKLALDDVQLVAGISTDHVRIQHRHDRIHRYRRVRREIR
jgi:hypothetical protein